MGSRDLRWPRIGEVSIWALLAASVLLMVAILGPIWAPLLLGAGLAGATHRPYRWLSRRLGDRPRLAAWLMTSGVVVVLLVPIGLLASVVVREAIQVVDFATDALDRGGLRELTEAVPAPLQGAVDDLSVDERSLRNGLLSASSRLADVAGGVITGGAAVLLGLALTLVAYFALLLNGPRLLAWIGSISPLPNGATQELLLEFQKTSTSALGSAFASAAAQGLAAFLVYLVAGVPNPVFAAVLTGVAGQIPAVGSSIVMVPIAAWFLVTGRIWQGVLIAAWGFFVVGTVDNIVKARVLKGSMKTDGTLVFFALIGGLLAFGPVGLLVGPLAVTFLQTMVRFVTRRTPDDDDTPPEAPSEPAPSGASPAGRGHGRPAPTG